jgi:hypothetical protein
MKTSLIASIIAMVMASPALAGECEGKSFYLFE